MELQIPRMMIDKTPMCDLINELKMQQKLNFASRQSHHFQYLNWYKIPASDETA